MVGSDETLNWGFTLVFQLSCFRLVHRPQHITRMMIWRGSLVAGYTIFDYDRLRMSRRIFPRAGLDRFFLFRCFRWVGCINGIRQVSTMQISFSIRLWF
jgi:hypothetical protein